MTITLYLRNHSPAMAERALPGPGRWNTRRFFDMFNAKAPAFAIAEAFGVAVQSVGQSFFLCAAEAAE